MHKCAILPRTTYVLVHLRNNDQISLLLVPEFDYKTNHHYKTSSGILD